MAKISRKPVYPQDENITPRDYLIGTNVNTPNLRTQTYSVESLINLANEVVGNSTSTFRFTTDRLITHLNKGFFTSENDETNPFQTTKLSFNKLTVQGVNISSAFMFLIENQFFNIKLKNISDVNNIVFLSPSNLIQNEDFITFDVSHFASNGLLIDGETYFLDYASFYYPFNNPGQFISKDSLSFASGSGAYNPATGVITIPTNNNQIPNGSGFLTGITLEQVITALGFTPYNSSNPSNFITNLALSPYALLSGANFTGEISATNLSNTNTGDNATNSQYSGLDSSKENTIVPGTILEYYRGDKTFQTLDKTAVGLENIDNTSDVDKPISTLAQNALNTKANISGQVFTGNISAPNLVGTNTGDQDLSSYATNVNLDLKANIESPTFTGQVGGIDKTMVGLSNADNTTDLNKPISIATQSALDLKINLTEKGVANGVVPLDSGAKILTTYLPDSILGNLKYAGTYNGFVINTSADFLELQGLDLPIIGYVGVYFITTTEFTRASVTYSAGDWILHNGGNDYVKVDNTDAVSTVFGRLGNILANEADYASFYYSINNPSNFISRNSLSFVAGSGSYNPATGVITIPTNTNQIANGAGFITNSALTPYALISSIPTNNNQLSNGSGFITSAALSPYALLSGANFTGPVSGITKAMVGLSNVDNTSDVNKPVSTATQTALDSKQNNLGFTPYNSTNPSGFTANSTDAQLRDRATHTGVQLSSTISDIQSAITNNTNVLANTDKVGITTAQANAIVTNTAKVGITTVQANAIEANTLKVTNANHTGEVTGATALTITNNIVSNGKLSQVPTKTFKGRTTAGTGNVEDLTVVQVRVDLSINNLDNTSDINKPISSATQNALNLKANTSSLGSNAFNSTVFQPADSLIFTYKGQVETNSNANLLSENGVYLNTTGNGTGSTNYPGGYGIISVIGNNGAYGGAQQHYDNNGELRIRARWDNVYTPWRRVWDSVNLTNNNQLTNGAGYLTAYTDTLATVTSRGSLSTSTIGITADGAGSDPYGKFSVTRGTESSFSYYGMTRAGQVGLGIGITTGNEMFFGSTTAGGEASILGASYLRLSASLATFNGNGTFNGAVHVGNYLSLVTGNDNFAAGIPWYGLGYSPGGTNLVHLSGWSGIQFNVASGTVRIEPNGNVVANQFNGSLNGNANSANNISGFNNPTTASTPNTIVYRDGAGDVSAREFIHTAGNVHGQTPSSIMGIFPTTNQVVRFNASAIQSFLGLGSMAYQGTGNYYTAGTSDGRFFIDRGFGAGFPSFDANTIPSNSSGFSYANNAPHSGPLTHFGAGGYGLQFSAQYSGNEMDFRTRNGDNATFRPWKRVLTDVNINSYALPLTGGTLTGRTTVRTTGYQSGPTLGVATGAFGILSDNTLYGMYSGVSSDGTVWMQVQRNDGNTSTYPLSLQPSGGSTLIGGILSLNAGNAGNNSYHELNRNSISTENMFTWKTASQNKWYLGQRNQGSENFSLYSVDVSDDIFRVTPNGITTFPRAVTAPTFNGTLNGSANFLANGAQNQRASFASNVDNGTPDTAAIEIRELNRSGSQGGSVGRGPSIGFHWGGVVFSHLVMSSDGVLNYMNHNRTGWNSVKFGGGFFTGTVTATDFIGSSDKRLKKEIKTLKVKEIQSVYSTFVFKSDETNQKRTGVIAQELELNHPEFVRTDEKGMKSVSYGDLHSAEIAYLKSENKILKAKLELIMNKLGI